MRHDDVIRALTDKADTPKQSDDRQRLTEAYFALSLEEGKRLAEYALAFPTQAGFSKQIVILENLAYVRPDCLQGLQAQLMEMQLDETVLFRGAAPTVRDRMIDIVEGRARWWMQDAKPAATVMNILLGRLAWIGDDIVVARFKQWATPLLPRTGSSPAYLAREAGWELEDDGPRRLYFEACHALQHAEIDIRLPQEAARCGHCGLPLVPLFDFDLTDARLRFLNETGRRLRLTICPHCTLATTLTFNHVDGQGAYAWHPDSPPPDQIDMEYVYPQLWTRFSLEVGTPRRSPFLGVAWLGHEKSQVGGFPVWVQYNQFPACPNCGLAMHYVSQFDCLPIGIDGVDGVLFAFLCQACRVGATRYQCT